MSFLENLKKGKFEDFNWRLTINFIIFLFIAKVFYFLMYNFKGRVMLFLMSFVQDVVLLVCVYFVFKWLINTGKLEKLWKYSFYVVQTVLFFMAGIYTKYIIDLMDYPINIFSVDFGLSSFFLSNFIELDFLFMVALLIVGVYFLSVYIPNRPHKNVLRGLGVVLLLLFIMSILHSGINPVFYSIGEEIKNLEPSPYDDLIDHLVDPREDYGDNDFSFLDKRLESIESKDGTNYDKVVVLVMESVDYDMYLRNSAGDEVLWNNNNLGCESYENYYTANLDSYPSLYAMLYSNLFPYRAYSNDIDLDHMEGENNNLVRHFNANDFSTYFVATFNDNPFLINEDEWTDVYTRWDFDRGRYVCLDISEVDSGCEDLMALDTMVELLRDNDKVFMFHEMIYGHVAIWEQEKGIEQVDYYNEFFNQLYGRLKEEGVSDEVLFVIVADHGVREDPEDIVYYHMPMMVCAEDMEDSENSDFASHLDMKSILFEKLYGEEFESDERIYFVGSSAEWIYGMVNEEGEYVLINDENLDVTTNTGVEEVVALNEGFQNYLAYFHEEILYE